MEGSVRALLDGALVHTWDAHGILSLDGIVTLFLDRVGPGSSALMFVFTTVLGGHVLPI